MGDTAAATLLAKPPADLLRVLEHIVDADPRPPGLAGHIAIGLAYPHGCRWLAIDCTHARPRLSNSDQRPHADATLLMGSTEGACILANQPFPEDALLARSGDQALLRAFLNRYLGAYSSLAIRSGKPSVG